MLKASDFRSREVINIADGEKLGPVFDMEINVDTGTIVSVVVPGKERLRLFSKNNGITIPWECIKKLGEDTILVELP